MSLNSPRLKQARALVVGDCMLDRYVYGNASRISPEAPVPVLSIERRDACLGGAANVAAGLRALEVEVSLAGIVGADSDGAELLRLADKCGIARDWLAVFNDARTICKTRVLADRSQQLIRLDEDGDSQVRARRAVSALSAVIEHVERFDVVVLCDYEKGTLPTELIHPLISRCRELGIRVVVDPKKCDFEAYAGASIVTPNRLELERAIGRNLATADDIAVAARVLRSRYGFEALLCTCGGDGMVLAVDGRTQTFPARQVQVADVTGAGDTVVAVIAAGVAAQQSFDEACRSALLAAAIAVKHPQVYVVGRAELEQARLRSSPKILPRQKLCQTVSEFRTSGRQIVFTNGCFDILHAGHLAYLEEARELGDLLIVGLNSDDSVRRLKGNSRPRIHQDHRAALLAGLTCVDIVVVFEEDTPEALLEVVRPDILVKGGDYAESQIVGADFVRGYGGEVIILPLIADISTTAILRGVAEMTD